MAFNFAEELNKARQTVHSTLGVSALYEDSVVVTPVEITVRYHPKTVMTGDFENNGWSETSASDDIIKFNITDARNVGVKRGGKITLVTDNIELKLETLNDKTDGYYEVWKVRRL